MVSPSSNFRKNQLLAALSNADLALLQPHLESVELEVRKVLESPISLSVGLLRLWLAIATNASKLVSSAPKE
jgi:hypothetical protein